MSYVVQIWEQPADLPLPDGAQAIWQMLSGLHQRPPQGRSPKFLELGRQLMQLYPEADDDPDGENDVWLDGRADGDVRGAVWNLGLRSGDRLDELQPVVAARATSLGLNVADEQAGDLYLADGRILSRREGAHCMRAFAAYFAGDHASAWQAFLSLAAQANREAIRNLALMALRGESVRKNNVLGHALLTAAGDADEAARLRRHMKPEAQAAADALLREMQRPGQLVSVVQRVVGKTNAGAELSLAPIGSPPGPPAVSPAAAQATPVAAPSEDLAALMQRARQGDKGARFDLACLYKAGDGVAQSDAQAVHWWTLAAEQGMAEAQYNLGVSYFFGSGAAKDEIKAFKWYCQAADAGHAEALYNLGLMYAQGLVVPRDPIVGKALFLHAKVKGSEHAKAPTYELGEAARVIALASSMGQSGKVLDTIAAWRRSQAKPSAKKARAPAADAPRPTAWHSGHAALILGALSLPSLLLMPGLGPGGLKRLMVIFSLATAYGVWRCARDLAFPPLKKAVMVLLAMVPVLGMAVCIDVLLQVLRRRRG